MGFEISVVSVLRFILSTGWFTCQNPLSAARNDLKMLKDIRMYHKTNKNISEAALKTFFMHLWYLSEVNIGFAFFDDDINTSTKKKMVNNLKKKLSGEKNRIRHQIDEKNLLKIQLWDFVTIQTSISLVY